MANKYLIFGATFNGDGTASNEAMAPGVAGAWNQTTVLTGTAPTAGTLAAGDTVYIRSKTGNGANANISNTLAANITLGAGSGVATFASPITWVLDNGVTWSGVDGTLTYVDGAASNFTVTNRDFNNFIALTKWAWIIKAVNTSANNSTMLTLGAGYTQGWWFDAAISATAGRVLAAAGRSTNRDFKFSAGSRGFVGALSLTTAASATFENIEWEAAYDVTASGTKPLIYLAGSTGMLRFIGGRLFGAGATSGVPLFTSFSLSGTCQIVGIGWTYPIAMTNVPAVYPYATQVVQSFTSLVGADAKLGAVLVDRWGQLDSRNDSNYPYLNAVLPDSVSTPWAWKLFAYLASASAPVNATVANKVYTDTAAAKTVTVNVQIANGITTADKANTWIDVIYTDNTTGLQVLCSSRNFAGGALAAGPAWSSSTYGVISMTSKSLSVTTPSSIKKDTQVQVAFNTELGIATASDVWFICPDALLS